MLDINSLISTVKRNSNISDAKFWGEYSICGLLLRLRELYRFEKGIKPWERIHNEDISEWISKRESLWMELRNKDFEDIIIGENLYNPFDVEKINEALEKENLIYGAGYGIRMKPSFFLADRISKKKVDGYVVHIAGSEYVRDLSTYPAMLQDGVIFIRSDTVKLFLWEKFDEMRGRGTRHPLTFAFSRYGINHKEEPSEVVDRRIAQVACSEAETYTHHELGEAFEGEKLGGEWEHLLVDFSGSKAELFSRGVKDLLADTSEKGMIPYIIENQKEGSLGFYIAALGGYRKVLFPEIIKAFEKFAESGDWGLIDDARKVGYKKAKKCAERLLSQWRDKKDKAVVSEYIEKELLSDT